MLACLAGLRLRLGDGLDAIQMVHDSVGEFAAPLAGHGGDHENQRWRIKSQLPPRG